MLNSMDTKDIVLEQITYEEFEQRKRYWKLGGPHPRYGYIFSRLGNPLIWPLKTSSQEEYLAFLSQIASLPNLCLMAVRNHNPNLEKKWLRVPPMQLTESRLDYLAKMAVEDTYKKNYLEAKFNILSSNSAGPAIWRAVIEFREAHLQLPEYEGLALIGYQATVPFEQRELFQVQSSTPYYHTIYGIWMPGDPLALTREVELSSPEPVQQ